MCKRVQTCSRQRKNCYQFNSKHLLISDVISNYRVFFSRYFEQVFYEIFFVWKSSFHFFVVVVYYTFFFFLLRSNVAAQEICETAVTLEIHGKLTCSSSLRQFSGLHQAAVLEKFNENNLAKVSFLKLLTKENLLFCCH